VTSDVGGFHYFFARGRSVVWIEVDDPDERYRLEFVGEAIRRLR
jgi:hypothetical protein